MKDFLLLIIYYLLFFIFYYTRTPTRLHYPARLHVRVNIGRSKPSNLTACYTLANTLLSKSLPCSFMVKGQQHRPHFLPARASEQGNIM